MLHIREDDPARQRFVLTRAAVRGYVVGQALSTVFALGPLLQTFVALSRYPEPPSHGGWLAALSLLFAVWVIRRFTGELVEIGFDGAAGRAWTVERGVFIWGTKRREHALEPGDQLAFRAGALTGKLNELGLVVELRGKAWTPVFAVDGANSRAQVVRLVEHVAANIGRSVVRTQDDVDGLRLFCGQESEARQVSREATTYRQAGPRDKLVLRNHVGFDAPAVPPNELGESGSLVDGLEVTESGGLLLRPAERAATIGPWLLVGGFVLLVVSVMPSVRVRPVESVSWGLFIPGTLAFVLGIRWLARRLEAWGVGKLRRPVLGPPPWGGRRVERAMLQGSTLELNLTRGTVQVTRADLVLIQHELRPGLAKAPNQQGLALWVLNEGSWYRLAEARSSDLTGPSSAALRRVAFEIARSLDAPLRVSAS